MFLCVSPNPAIDKRLRVESLQRARVNRANAAQSFAGGKAAHVAMVLRTLGESPKWIGPCGGANGRELLAGLAALGIEAIGIPAQQPTRTNLEILEDDGTVTEILEPGARLTDIEWAAFDKRYSDLLAGGAGTPSVVLSGSLPQGAAVDFYARCISAAHEHSCRTFLDTSGEALRRSFPAKPEFVKPNRQEASRLLERELDSLQAAAGAVRKLLELGAKRAALSMGKDGLLYCAGLQHPVLYAPALPVQACSPVGCGDSALAGFVLGLSSDYSPEESLRLAAACATSNCLAESPGAARLEDIRRFQRQVTVQQLETHV
jgi:1-phosphofructokinase family hexose kinase